MPKNRDNHKCYKTQEESILEFEFINKQSFDEKVSLILLLSSKIALGISCKECYLRVLNAVIITERVGNPNATFNECMQEIYNEFDRKVEEEVIKTVEQTDSSVDLVASILNTPNLGEDGTASN